MISIVLWLVGIVLIAIAVLRVRTPFARMGELDQLASNAQRYELWRGGRSHTAAGGRERTGADEMKDLLRRQVYLWAGMGVVGVLLVVGGFLYR
jgi:hypothetical protein